MFKIQRHPAFLAIGAALLSFAAAFPLGAQTSTLPAAENFTLPTAQGCSNQLGGAKPKIYIANFLVTYGKKTMGRLIADNIAFRFESDERFELIPRKTIDKEMSSLFKKKLKPEEYLNLAVSLAAEHQADCVIFGKIGKKGSQISFLVRMAAVTTGENKIKVDEDVERKEASAFFERTGESLVAYFNAAAPVPVVAEQPRKESSRIVLVAWGGYSVFLPNSDTEKTINYYKSFSGSNTTLGGISGGADLWIRVVDGFDLGAGVGYLSIWNYKYTLGSATYERDIRFMPIMAQLRLISGAGLYLAAGFGYFNSLSQESLTQSGQKISISISDGAPAISGSLGWQIKLGSSVVMDLGVKFWHILERSPGEVITPFAGFGFRF